MDASLSARRAWIEIPVTAYCAYLPMVALRKESVDRNIMVDDPDLALPAVALRKESVDRNGGSLPVFLLRGCRSPQGERG